MSVPQWLKDAGEVVKSWGTGIAALGAAAVLGWINKGKVKEIHLTMNSRLDELLKSTKEDAHGKGRREGIESEQERVRPKEKQ